MSDGHSAGFNKQQTIPSQGPKILIFGFLDPILKPTDEVSFLQDMVVKPLTITPFK